MDKAVSVGEKSKVYILKGNINNSKIGIASKDSSDVKLREMIINNADICFSAYNKKQEFNGASIKVDNFECQNSLSRFYNDQNSFISFNNE